MAFLPKSGEGRAAFRVALAASVAVNVLGLASAFASRAVYDNVIPNHAASSLAGIAAVMGIVFAVDGVLRSVRNRVVEAVQRHEETCDGVDIPKHVLDLDPGSVDSHALLSVLRSADCAREMRSAAVVFGAVDLPFAVAATALTFLVAGPVGFVPAAFGAFNLALSAINLRRVARAAAESSSAAAARNRLMEEAVAGLESWQLLDAGGQILDSIERAGAKAAETASRMRLISQGGLTLGSTSSQIASFAVLAAGAPLTFDGSLTAGALLAASILTGRAIQPFLSAAAVAAKIGRGLSAQREVDAVLALPARRPENPVRFVEPRGAVRFERVRYSYPGSDVSALDGFDLSVAPGERVGVVGLNGAGKSTLWRLLSGISAPSEGRVCIDELRVGDIDPSVLRRAVGVLPQNPGFITGTVAQNLTLGNSGVSADEVGRVCLAMGMDWLRSCGLETPIRPKIGSGAGTSAGRLQQLANARVVLRDPRVVFLDEPTSNLDAEAEARWVEFMRGWLKGRTAFLVSHKPQLLFPEAGLVDRVIVVDRGRLAALSVNGGPTVASLTPEQYRRFELARRGGAAKAA